MPITILKYRWDSLLREMGVKTDIADSLFLEVVHHYSEPHRCYHNLFHLDAMFDELDTCDELSNEVLWASWYHDLIYDPGKSSNEEKSMIKVRDIMQALDFSESFVERVCALILATKFHRSSMADEESKLFLDADMAILGSDERSYKIYCRQIRQEYKRIPSFLFNKSRKTFLQSIQSQQSIFSSSVFQSKYEQRAQRNIANELGQY